MNITSLIKSMLVEGSTYDLIMQEVYQKFPQAKTTHKSIASIACNLRKYGGLDIPKQASGGFKKASVQGVRLGLDYQNF